MLSACTKYWSRLSVLLGLLLVSCGSVNSEPEDSQIPLSVDVNPSLTPDETLVIGDISGNPTKKIGQYKPLADYLKTHLVNVGIKDTTVKIAPDLETMQTWIETGEVDLYFDSPYPVMIISTNTGAEPILRRWKQGIPEYTSIIFTQDQSAIQAIDDLEGKRIALESNFSTSGYMLPLISLQNANLTLVEQSSEQQTLQPNEVGFVFSNDQNNTIELVLSGTVEAGALDNGTFAQLPAEVSSALRIISESESVARHIALVSPDLTTEQTNAIRKILIDMDTSPEGKAVLEQFENTAKFDDFPVEQSIERLRVLYNQTLQ